MFVFPGGYITLLDLTGESPSLIAEWRKPSTPEFHSGECSEMLVGFPYSGGRTATFGPRPRP